MIDILSKIKNSRLLQDSFWAVYGSGIGYGLLLLSGILIARLLGKDLYGEYGLVKSTMFLMASFASFGLQFTSTKFIAESIKQNVSYVRSYARDALTITIASSSTIAVLIIIFSGALADFLGEPELRSALRLLGGLIIVRAFTSSMSAILSGFGAFKILARNNIICGSIMVITCYPFTYFFGLSGAFASLVLSQLCNASANYASYIHQCKRLAPQKKKNFKKELMTFSFPVALQEISYSVCHWGGILLITKLSTLGELGIYSAVTQWNSIILFIPSMLVNVVLAHLSRTQTSDGHIRIVKKVLLVNFVCSFVPFVIVSIISDFIVSFYGTTFTGMSSVLRVITFSTIFICCGKVLYTELLSINKTWLVFGARFCQDIILLITGYFLIKYSSFQASLAYSIATVGASIMYFLTLLIFSQKSLKHRE